MRLKQILQWIRTTRTVKGLLGMHVTFVSGSTIRSPTWQRTLLEHSPKLYLFSNQLVGPWRLDTQSNSKQSEPTQKNVDPLGIFQSTSYELQVQAKHFRERILKSLATITWSTHPNTKSADLKGIFSDSWPFIFPLPTSSVVITETAGH